MSPYTLPLSAIPQSVLTKNQRKKYGPVTFMEDGKEHTITATVRHDDECGNGHNSFAITADIRGEFGTWEAGGCCHEDIARHFPELRPFIKWHLCSSDGPMHYVANTRYMAGNRDCWGKLKGEAKSFHEFVKFGSFPITYGKSQKFVAWLKEHNGQAMTIKGIAHEPDENGKVTFADKYTFDGYCTEWYRCPFDTEREANEFLQAWNGNPVTYETVAVSFGEGKERQLDAAREAAIWPEATDEELTAPGLEDRLLARLPALLQDFKRDVESLGFVY